MKSIIIIEDHSIVRTGIETLIQKDPELSIVGSYEKGEEGLKAIKLEKPDLLILDLNLQDLPGEMIARDLFLGKSETKIIVLTQENYIPQVVHLLKLGVKAYVVKDQASKELPKAIEAVTQGEKYISPSLQQLLEQMGYYSDEELAKKNSGSLSPREKEVAQLLCRGLKGEDIASKLNISPVTVRVHTKNILKKLKLDNLKNLSQVRDKLF